ncbi:hypothetical protein BGZ76_010856 [Entomortierella beljakovae]|nr:hypothetical protein BGZ76_010856 [Entomortierella beljakovae]
MDHSKTTFPYASFARSVNLKWIHDTFDLPEVEIQTLTGFRWTRNEAPKDFLIRHLLANRPYLNNFVHCHESRLSRCLFAHMATATLDNFGDDITDGNTLLETSAISDWTNTEGSIAGAEPANTVITANTASTDSDDWTNMMQQVMDDDFLTNVDPRLLSTPPLLPVQQPIATAMPLAHSTAVASSSGSTSSHPNNENSEQPLLAQTNYFEDFVFEAVQSLPSHVPTLDLVESNTDNSGEPIQEVADHSSVGELGNTATDAVELTEPVQHIESEAPETAVQSSNDVEQTQNQIEIQSVSHGSTPNLVPSTQPIISEAPTVEQTQTLIVPAMNHTHFQFTAPSSILQYQKPFLPSWPLTKDQTQSLVYLDLRHAIVTNSLVVSLSQNCHKIEYLKIATHWQHYHSYSVNDVSLARLMGAQHGLKLVHVENHREVSQGHELIRTIDTLAKHHGSTLETLVLKSHDFQNCNLGALGKACQKLTKFAAPGGIHLFRDEILKLTGACKLTLEHLDFSNSDIETDCLMAIMRGTFTPPAAKGVLKALILLGMEDTLNQDTCLAIGEHGSGLDCFRLDILESEAKDVALMLSRSCAINLRVLTLGCHDVHGDLANDILEQIALNCRNVELLDINHWQFSAKAIENVLRECSMLRYLNVSYTVITESTANVICKCLGEVEEESIQENISSITFMSTPIHPDILPESYLQTPVPAQARDIPVVDHPVSMSDISNDEDDEVSMPHVENEGDAVENLDEERIDLIRKRGTDLRVKDDEDDTEVDSVYMDTNSDSDRRLVAAMFPANSGLKKQSQQGLTHHYQNAMDLRTIMNLDLDEAFDMDTSMESAMDRDISMNLPILLPNSSYHEKACEEDVEMMSDDENDAEEVARTKEPKGKEVYVGPDYEDHRLEGISTIFVTTAQPFPSSFESTSSASSSSSSSSSVGSSSSSGFMKFVSELNRPQGGQILVRTAESGVTDLSACSQLLPPLPIPSSQDGGLNPDVLVTPVGKSMPFESVQDGPELTISSEDNNDSSIASLDISQAPPTNSVVTGNIDSVELPLTALLENGDSEMTLVAASEAVESQEDASNSEEVSLESLEWTKESRLEQVNVECCSLLLLSTMTKIKSLSNARQAKFAQQGRKKTRIWVENEHDMMMTRLAMERGPEPPARTTPRVDTIVSELSSAESDGNGVNVVGESSITITQSQGANENEQPIDSMETQESTDLHHQQQQQQEPPSGLTHIEGEQLPSSVTVDVVA